MPIPRLAPIFGMPRFDVPRGWIMRPFSFANVPNIGWWLLVLVASPFVIMALAWVFGTIISFFNR